MNLQHSLSFDQKLWSEIDKKRGDVSRSRFLASIVAEVLDASKNKRTSFKNGLDTNGEETQ